MNICIHCYNVYYILCINYNKIFKKSTCLIKTLIKCNVAFGLEIKIKNSNITYK